MKFSCIYYLVFNKKKYKRCPKHVIYAYFKRKALSVSMAKNVDIFYTHDAIMKI